MPLLPAVDLEQIARTTPGLTAPDLANQAAGNPQPGNEPVTAEKALLRVLDGMHAQYEHDDGDPQRPLDPGSRALFTG